jgi:adenine/guanine phosphoribosyltransferase-like PRPP-binding protein
MFSCSSYHEENYHPQRLKARIRRMAKKLISIRKKHPFDAIAFRGTSGAALAYPLSVLHGYHLICVRRSGRKNNHGGAVEASERKEIKKYIIVDDFVCSGKTVQEIVETINKQFNNSWSDYPTPKCVGVLLANGYDDKRIEISEKEEIPVFSCPKR